MCRVVVAVRPGRLMTMAVMAGAILMMPEGHALARHDRGHPLYRDGQSQQQDGEQTE